MTDTFFITGTDTEVGKTVASTALLQAANQRNLKTAGYKPVAAGSEEMNGEWVNEDAMALLTHSSVSLSYQQVNPCLFHAPCSPHIAAEMEGKSVDFNTLSAGLAELKTRDADLVIVEGAGGWRVPVSSSLTLASWVKQEKLPVILVVGVKLGCLNHALLTAEAIRFDGLELVGWIANRVNPGVEHYSEIVATLKHQLNAPLIGEIPYLPMVGRQDAGKYIDLSVMNI